MRIKPGDIIAGQSALVIRKLFKNTDGKGTINTIAEILCTDLSIAQDICQNLLQEGYIEYVDNLYTNTLSWQTTIKGNALAHASARKPITRRTADKLVENFLKRVREVNTCKDYAYYVKKVIIFGSYLSNRPDLGDVDLAVTLEFRYNEDNKRRDQFNKRIQHAIDQGRTFKNMVEQYGWPQIEVFRILKSSLPSLSIHDIKTQEEFLQSVPTKLLFEANEEEIIRDKTEP